jgi:hypothetical protein
MDTIRSLQLALATSVMVIGAGMPLVVVAAREVWAQL